MVMNHTIALASILALLGACAGDSKSSDVGEPPTYDDDDDSAAPDGSDISDVSEQLETIRQNYSLPALAGLRLEGDAVTHQGVTGVRKLGDDTLATVDDKWHIGSCTKAMTATLVGIHVDDGLLDWTSTMGELFPDITAMHDEFREVTIEMLLSHTSRVNDAASNDAYLNTYDSDEGQWRQNLTHAILQNPPAGTVGASENYSNFGYVIAGHALEQLTDSSWESLMQDRLFEPLNMTGCGFGAAAAVGDVSQPWGHTGLEPSNGDNPAVLGPAGTVHCPLADWGRFISDQLRAFNGEESILSADQAEHMFTVQADNYAMGWIVLDAPAVGGTVFGHTGSNTFSIGDVLAAPSINRGYLVATNRAGSMDINATQQALLALHDID